MNASKGIPELLIIGLGNRLAGDDGAGCEVAARLRARRLPGNVRVEEAPGGVLSLISIWQQEDHVWLIDAVLSGKEAGSIVVLDKSAIFDSPRAHLSAHALSLSQSLLWLQHTYPDMGGIRYRLWGIEAGNTSMGEGLSPAVAAAVDKTVDHVCAEAALLLQ